MTGATAPLSRPSALSRAFGLGSVFGKTLRDSRRATLIVGVAIGALLIVVAAGIISQFNTAEARQEIGNIVNAVPPIMQGLAGKPVNVETLGGYIQYKYGGFLPLVTGLWSILALSATLAGESRRGSMDLLVAAPLSRRRIAWQKVLGHILMVGVAMAIIGAAIAVAGSAVATLPGDKITLRGRLRLRRLALPDVGGRGRTGIRAGAVRGAWIGRGVGRRRHARRLPAERLPAGHPGARAVRQPDLVRLDHRPHPVGQPVRLAVAGVGRRLRGADDP